MAGRFKDIEWNLADDQGRVGTWERVQVAVLMDLRDELKRLNNLLACPNFVAIPRILRGIRRNTARRKRAVAKVTSANKRSLKRAKPRIKRA
jgi:hypothetical protein